MLLLDWMDQLVGRGHGVIGVADGVRVIKVVIFVLALFDPVVVLTFHLPFDFLLCSCCHSRWGAISSGHVSAHSNPRSCFVRTTNS